MDGEEILQGVFVLGVALILVGLFVAIIGGIGEGLMTIGVGCILSGLGGSVHFETRYRVISGTTGAVLILIGAFFDYLNGLLGE